MTAAEREVQDQLVEMLFKELNPATLSLSFLTVRAVDGLDEFDKDLPSVMSVEDYVSLLMEVRKVQKVTKSLTRKLSSLVDSLEVARTSTVLPFQDVCNNIGEGDTDDAGGDR